ncbi:hypothetical protein Dimus_011610 [Dionaea muscipula]
MAPKSQNRVPGEFGGGLGILASGRSRSDGEKTIRSCILYALGDEADMHNAEKFHRRGGVKHFSSWNAYIRDGFECELGAWWTEKDSPRLMTSDIEGDDFPALSLVHMEHPPLPLTMSVDLLRLTRDVDLIQLTKGVNLVIRRGWLRRAKKRVPGEFGGGLGILAGGRSRSDGEKTIRSRILYASGGEADMGKISTMRKIFTWQGEVRSTFLRQTPTFKMGANARPFSI